MADITITDIMDNIDTISTRLSNNKLIIDARESLIEGLDNTEITTEQRQEFLSQYEQNISLGLVAQAVELAKNLPLLNADVALKASQKAEITANIALINEQKGLVTKQKYTEDAKLSELNKEIELKECLRLKCIVEKELFSISKYEKMGSASKQLGILVTHTSWQDQGNGLIDRQIKGFSGDMRHKILRSLSEQAGMLAQNSIATPPWMTTEMQASISYMKTIT